MLQHGGLHFPDPAWPFLYAPRCADDPATCNAARNAPACPHALLMLPLAAPPATRCMLRRPRWVSFAAAYSSHSIGAVTEPTSVLLNRVVQGSCTRG